MQFDNKTTRKVAEVAAQIMANEAKEGTEPKTEKEKSLAALAHPKDKITHKDVLVGRGVLNKEEVELDEANKETKNDFKARQERLAAASAQTAKDPVRLARLSKIPGYTAAMDLAKKTTQKEEFELEEELAAWQKVQRKKDEMEDRRRERMERENMPEPEKKKPTTQKVAGHRYGGSKQKDETNEEFMPFTQMLESYAERGLKALSGIIKEEPDNEQFTSELKDQEAKDSGKKKAASVSAPATQGVKAMPEEYETEDELTLDDFTPEEIEEFMQTEEFEQIDELSKGTLGSYIRKAAKSGMNSAHHAGQKQDEYTNTSDVELANARKRLSGIRRATRKMEEEVELDERELTEPEMKEKERIVKGMKKGLEGFKQRYGERAKEVMYATATARAKGD